MGFFSSFLNPGAKEAKAGYADATGMLQQGETKARGELTTGYDQAGNFLSQAGKGIGAAYGQANNALNLMQSRAMRIVRLNRHEQKHHRLGVVGFFDASRVMLVLQP